MCQELGPQRDRQEQRKEQEVLQLDQWNQKGGTGDQALSRMQEQKQQKKEQEQEQEQKQEKEQGQEQEEEQKEGVDPATTPRPPEQPDNRGERGNNSSPRESRPHAEGGAVIMGAKHATRPYVEGRTVVMETNDLSAHAASGTTRAQA